MPRIEPVQVADASGRARELFEGVQREMGMVPNPLKTLGHSEAALSAYLSFSQSLQSALTPVLREQIALAVAGFNGCDYCASAHTALGARVGIDEQELIANLKGESADVATRAALQFARSIVGERGEISDRDLRDVREAGFTEPQLVEIIAVVALNLFTNYFSHIVQTDIEFPLVHATPATDETTRWTTARKEQFPGIT